MNKSEFYEWIRVDIMNEYEQELILWMNINEYNLRKHTKNKHDDFINEYERNWMNTIKGNILKISMKEWDIHVRNVNMLQPYNAI